MGWSASWGSAMVDRSAGGYFDAAAIRERLEQAPPSSATDPIPPSRWTLSAIQAAVPALADDWS